MGPTSMDMPAAHGLDSSLFDKLGLDYERAFAHDQGLHSVLDRFLSLLPSGARVLDCGCGTGKPVAEKVVMSGRKVHGIDLSIKMLELSRSQVPGGTFEKANMLSYSPSAPVDGAIFMLSLFELTRAQLEALSLRCYQWIKPGGYVLLGSFSADDCPGAASDMYDADGEFAKAVPNRFMNHAVYANVFTRAGWQKLLLNAGFRVVHENFNVFIPPEEALSDDEPHYFLIGQKI